MPLNPGTSFGPYEIVAPLGAGGMGEVYRARDAKLGRDVAIKVLPQEVAADPERLARFEREARVLASLNHPNIGAIYGLEESGGIRGLVLELIEGKTLQQELEAGRLPLERAIRLGVQIAEALEAAHAKGIIHRDLKPANVKVTPDGVVKVLDFGLAKSYGDDASSPDSSMSPTLTVAATRAGVILGTAAYMSPEQAAGQAVDHRSDIWSFGVVLLEMLSGRRPFHGETVSHTLAAILKDDPDVDALRGDVPPRLVELVGSCLRKKARMRLQAIGDARVVLEDYLADPASFAVLGAAEGPIAQAPAGRARLLPWAVTGLLAVALATALALLWPRAPRPGTPGRFSLLAPKDESLFRGYGSSIAISPDGSRVAWVGGTEIGSRNLYLRDLDRWDWTLLVAGEPNREPYHPFFSPDGEWIGYVTRTELRKVPIRGGSSIALATVGFSRGAAWSPDGTIIFSPNPSDGLFRVPESGGEAEPLTKLDPARREVTHRWPQVLPGGRAVLFTALSSEGANFDTASLEILVLDSGERRRLHEGGSYGRYLPSGQIAYVNRGTLFVLPFDVDRLEVTGLATPVVEDLASNDLQGGAQYDVSNGGTLVYAVGGSVESGASLIWRDPDGKITPLWEGLRAYGSPTFSPDGTLLAVDVAREGTRDVWIYDLRRDVPTRLTVTEDGGRSPAWSPDGRFLYYGSSGDIYRIPSDGSGEPELILGEEPEDLPASVSPDGKWLAIDRFGGGSRDIWLLPLEGGDPRPLVSTPGVDYGARFSPDGRWVAYGSSQSGSFQIYVMPADGGRGRWQISTGFGAYPVWSVDGRRLFYQGTNGSLLAVSAESTSGAFRAGRPEEVSPGPFEIGGDGVYRYTVAPDGRFVLMQRPPQEEAAPDVHLVLNWFDDLAVTLSPTASR